MFITLDGKQFSKCKSSFPINAKEAAFNGKFLLTQRLRKTFS